MLNRTRKAAILWCHPNHAPHASTLRSNPKLPRIPIFFCYKRISPHLESNISTLEGQILVGAAQAFRQFYTQQLYNALSKAKRIEIREVAAAARREQVPVQVTLVFLGRDCR